MAYAADSRAISPAAYANWGQRVGAYLIDYVPIFVERNAREELMAQAS